MIEGLPFTIAALRAAYGEGLRPEAVVAESLRRIEVAGDPGIFLDLVPRQRLIAEATGLGPHDPERPLWGVPFAVKDNIDLGGRQTTAACPAFAYEAGSDAFVVERLRAGGALAIGKTNLDQFATGLVGVRTPYPVPRNALDPAVVPGGSSSGSAVAVARGLVAFALGTDTAGSGRVPAALNNIVGLKPTLGAISTRGVVPACRTIDAVSVFALTVDDAWTAFAAAAGLDPADPYSRPVPAGPLGAAPPHPRIGVPDAASRRFFGDAAQEAAFDAASAALEAMGAHLVPVDLGPFFAAAEMLYGGAWVAERLAVVEQVLKRDPSAVLPVIRTIVAPASELTGIAVFRDLYRLEELRAEVRPVLASVDLLCVPSIPTFYTVADLAADPVEPNRRLGTYTNFANLLGLCGLAVPAPARSDGRPGSVTLIGRAGHDAVLASLGRRVERLGHRTLGATGWALPPAAEVPAAGPDEVAVAVCGAHMSGLPLNGEVTGLGGRFLREARTAPAYRLYALAGGPPRRPGMVRCADGKGAAIHVEVWSLPKARVGEFLAGIPAPLGLGTIELGDGMRVKGFLCEAVGTVGATDVSAIGDWRRVIAEAAA